MKDRNDTSRTDQSDIDIARLISDAGPRPRLTEFEAARLRRAATAAWEAEVRRRRTRRWSAVSALAASVVAGIAIAWWLGVGRAPLDAARPVVADVVRIVGRLEATAERGSPALLAEGHTVRIGDRLAVSESGGAALLLANRMQLRAAGGTVFVAVSADTFRLETGRLYADSGPGRSDATSVTIRTSEALISDIGTQFQVIAASGATRVLVREGEVRVRTDTGVYAAHRGDAIAVATDGSMRRGSATPDDADWHWTESIAVNPDVDGRPVIDLLRWVARETGKTLVFADAGVEADARRIVLGGTIRNLTPLQSLDAMLKATDLDYELTADGAIVVKRRPR